MSKNEVKEVKEVQRSIQEQIDGLRTSIETIESLGGNADTLKKALAEKEQQQVEQEIAGAVQGLSIDSKKAKAYIVQGIAFDSLSPLEKITNLLDQLEHVIGHAEFSETTNFVARKTKSVNAVDIEISVKRPVTRTLSPEKLAESAKRKAIREDLEKLYEERLKAAGLKTIKRSTSSKK